MAGTMQGKRWQVVCDYATQKGELVDTLFMQLAAGDWCWQWVAAGTVNLGGEHRRVVEARVR